MEIAKCTVDLSSHVVVVAVTSGCVGPADVAVVAVEA